LTPPFVCDTISIVKVLGLDPGFKRLGYAGLEEKESKVELITYGVISNDRADLTWNQNLNEGIEWISIELPRLIDRVKPHVIMAELVPPGKLGSNDSLVVAATTTCKVVAFQFGIPWQDIAASTIKKELTGDGRATKAVVKNAVFDLFPSVEMDHLNLKKEQKARGEKASGHPQDAFDALAISYIGCQLNGKGT
jgi:crossover junction endodeoxyribonuclease RuvC